MRIAVVGPFTWFENHFPENWRTSPDVLCLDVNERDYSWLIILRNYKPDITLFYRPELYPPRYLRHIAGVRVALLSEPLPVIAGKVLLFTDESTLRLKVYQGMCWDAFHWRIYYDQGKAASAAMLGFRIDEFRPLPINTALFYPPPKPRARKIDVCFIGKATPHRIAKLDFLRLSRLQFLWIAHGISGEKLAQIFRCSRLVLNVHADAAPALEPRLFLAAACGCRVVSETLSMQPTVLKGWVAEENRSWSDEIIGEHLALQGQQIWTEKDEIERQELGVRRLINSVCSRFNVQ